MNAELADYVLKTFHLSEDDILHYLTDDQLDELFSYAVVNETRNPDDQLAKDFTDWLAGVE